MGAQVIGWLALARYEVMLFAAAGLTLGGVDDLVIDLLYGMRRLWRVLFVHSRYPRMTSADLPPPARPGRCAIFIPAWHEQAVLPETLRGMLARWRGRDFMLFVGTYPNDPDTIRAVTRVAEGQSQITLVVHDHDGPTTKADCLNRLWRAMLRAEEEQGFAFKAVVLHDAEDVVHPDELALFDLLIERFAMIQLPVRPLLTPRSRWIAGHYADEFAEAHGKYLITRERLGASVPSAGVGCAFERGLLGRLAAAQNGMAFDPRSLTEDYEIGLRIAELGAQGIFVRMRDGQGDLICTQEHFPETLDAAIRQKARWLAGIALAGWDRMGWRGGLRERWARLHDRRAGLAAIVLLAAYVAILLYGALLLVELFTAIPVPTIDGVLPVLLWITGALMLWRLAVRAAFVTRAYGWRQGLLSIPRTFIGNYIAILAARRAVGLYVRQLRSGEVIWDKTDHHPRATATQIP